jgi:predicted lipoprotein
MGNFCTFGRFSLSGTKAYAPIIKITMDKKGAFIRGKIVSARQKSKVFPYIDPAKLAFKEIKKLTKADFPKSKIVFNEDGSFYLKK